MPVQVLIGTALLDVCKASQLLPGDFNHSISIGSGCAAVASIRQTVPAWSVPEHAEIHTQGDILNSCFAEGLEHWRSRTPPLWRQVVFQWQMKQI